MAQPRRRVSYIIPPPPDPAPVLQLPPHGVSRLGSIGPLLLPPTGHVGLLDEDTPKLDKHTGHRLGVASLALDTATLLSGHASPGGILYSGGRDGMIMSWDLGIPMARRNFKESLEQKRSSGRWELMTGWGDEAIDEEAEDGDERLASDGDVLGDVTLSLSQRRRRTSQVDSGTIPHEQQWETDLNAFKPGTPSQFRQRAQTHTDWVNDILLCNYNQTVVSASSDGTVKAWNPHSALPSDPTTIGSHSDYVRCLSHCREQSWVASGSFDRTIKLWDLNRPAQAASADPLITLNPPDATAPKSSVYAIASDPFGRTIASGSPERVVRLWDPRSGKRTAKLVGHTDNIRAILISEDSKYLLTGSADASIKLWSLASQRCLHTFTYHTDSVWSLFSSHPSLEIFYSGDRSGLVCKVDVEDCTDVSEGECVLICQDSADQNRASSEGINKIVAMDDNVLWTASGSSSIRRWRVPPSRAIRAATLAADLEGEQTSRSNSPMRSRRANSGGAASEVNTRPSTGHGNPRSLAPSVKSMSSVNWLLQRDREAETTFFGIAYESLIKLVSPNDPFGSYTSGRSRDPEVATLYSAASVMSVPHTNVMRSPIQAVFSHTHATAVRSSRTDDTVHPANTARADYEERELAADAVPLYTTPDHIIDGDHGLIRCIILNDRIHALTVDTSGDVAVWDIARGNCMGKFPHEIVSAASTRGSTTGGSGSGDRERSPREVLETVRERIEGEAIVAPWCTADTKTGVLTIHMNDKSFEAEIYADEVGFPHDRHFNDESKLNIGKWVLRNLFLGFIREEQRIRRKLDNSNSDNMSITRVSSESTRKRLSTSPDSHRKSSRSTAGSTIFSSPKLIPVVPPTVSALVRTSPLVAPMIPLFARENMPLASIAQSPLLNSNVATPKPQRMRSGTLESGQTSSSSSALKDGDYFGTNPRQTLQGPPLDDPSRTDPTAIQIPTTPGSGGLMGRLKNFGKISTKRPVSEASSFPITGAVVTPFDPMLTPMNHPSAEPDAAKDPLQALLAGPLTPTPSSESPSIYLPSSTAILITEEASPSVRTLYRGSVSCTQYDVRKLEETMPMWLLEYLLLNKIPTTAPQIKVSFVLLPWPNKEPGGEQLPELLNTTQSKLTANRLLRVRKLVTHVQDKLDRMSVHSDSDSRSSADGRERTSTKQRAEDAYEVLCNDVLLPLDMSIAAVRQYVWKQTTELTIYYRRKVSTHVDNGRPNGS